MRQEFLHKISPTNIPAVSTRRRHANVYGSAVRDRDVNRRPRLYTMSAIPPKADIGERDQDVRFVPNCDID